MNAHKTQYLAAFALALSSLPVVAADGGQDLKQQIDALQSAMAAQQAQMEAQKQQLAAQAAQLEVLRQKLQEQEAATTATVAATNQTKLVAQEASRLTVTGGRPTFASADGQSSLSLRANVQLDAAHYAERDEGPLNTDFRRGSVGGAGNRETNAARDFSDGMYFRRARLGVEGVLARDFNYRLLLELGGAGTEGPTRINDAWINYTGFAPFTIQLGAFSPPANMDDGTTPEDLVFIERASSSELSRALGGADGRLGIGVRASGSRWMSALTLTTRTVNDAEVFDSQLAAVGRVGFLAATSADYNVHLGLSGTYVFSPADQGSAGTPPRHAIRMRDRPEIRIDSTRLIDTGAIDADHAYATGIEFGANWKSFYLQAEHFDFGIHRREPTALRDPDFGGYYVQGSWILTGESRRYNAASGSFQNPRPFLPFSWGNAPGAWELALRYSHTDLNFAEGSPGAAATASTVRGGEQNVWTFGVNWYVNPNLKLLANYLRIDVDRLNPAGPGNATPFGAAPGTPPLGAQIGQDLNVYALRTQFSF